MVQSHMKVADHCPSKQSIMQKVASTYHLPCWRRGMCRSNGSLYRQQSLLHGTFFREIKRQIDCNLPGGSTKEFLCSSDVCIAVRFRKELQLPDRQPDREPECMVFLLAKMVLRPEAGVLAEMDMDSDSGTVGLRVGDDGAFNFLTSWELCASLLCKPVEAVWVSVLEHQPVPLVWTCFSFSMRQKSSSAVGSILDLWLWQSLGFDWLIELNSLYSMINVI